GSSIDKSLHRVKSAGQSTAFSQKTHPSRVKNPGGPSGNDPFPGGYLLLEFPGERNSFTWNDYVVSADFIWTDNDKWGIMFYYTDNLNYYRYRIEQRDSVSSDQNPTYWLEKFVNGDYTSLSEGEIEGARIPNAVADGVEELHNLKASAINGTIEIFLDDQSVAQVTDTDLTQGTIAFYHETNFGWIDNFRISGGVVSVEPAGKLATMWGRMKANY
ncbi:MAG: hypothetical protein O7E52_10505, partial [Candidatus Poribacteria bacterium]|nr:hypothetical protein [Candidatus Poribacteria bacterium]